MRIVCPACHATYEVPPALLGTGARRVRCARCTAEWTPAAAPAPEAPPAAAAPADAPPQELRIPDPHPAEPRRTGSRLGEVRPGEARLEAEPKPERRRRAPGRIGVEAVAALVISLAILVGLAAVVFVWREEVMAAWEPSKRLFAWLGLR
ncbi:zinc-ribbon domain-containing protein [Rhodovastum sp. RN2-1]|uniref:Zinc-ribbon domain-containing protein n=2 Tax=Limobrevibacterium gyesilva TaxID=2991712 RepID=A0AA41YNV7_9PROT|nr:zinc-ribbon domain-containing protein [Limobrevibacterium gyesilva]MCW3476994.1 zinc-ribbon domain-containing protein [Limobrevibacterium gyesilva]